MKQFQNVSSRYGAPMGRDGFGTLENVEPRALRLFAVRLDRGGYDDGGAYWGHGATLWCARTEDGEFFQTCRAGSRESAALQLEIAPDYLDRLARPINRRELVRLALAIEAGRAPSSLLPWRVTVGDIIEACKDSRGFAPC